MKKNFFFILLFFYIGTYAQDIPNSKADIIVFSYDRPLQLYALLESLEKYVTNINSITLVYRTSNERYNDAFKMVAACFPNTRFLHQQSVYDFKTLTIQALKETSSDYVVFAVDDNIVKDFINLDECIGWLEHANAYGFYLKLGTHLDYCYTENSLQALPPMIRIHDDIFSWEFDSGEKDWNYPNTVDMTLYRKKDLISLFESLDYTNPNLLEGKWAAWWVAHKAPSPIGLFYENSKILNIPLNKVQTINPLNRDMNLYTPQELLEAFEMGLKMNIAPLYLMKNRAVHTEYEPTFILRAKQINIGLCIVATGKYISFVKKLLDSAELYFCPQHKRTYFIFTDAMLSEGKERHELQELLQVPYSDSIVIIEQKRLGWPYDTLMRFVVYNQHKDVFATTDYMFATDADMLFVGTEGDEIVSERVATQHPGFEKNKPLWGEETPYDRNPLSTAYIPHGLGEYYFAGGFYGGSTKEFIKMSEIIAHNIFIDLEKYNYIAVWHDESHLNRYFIDNKPTIMLDRSYCYPENGQQKGYPTCAPKLLALDKNHDEIRE
jgi:histo-blood group ABO system transferase